MRQTLLLVLAGLVALLLCSAAAAIDYRNVAKHAAAKHGWTGYQWVALDTIVKGESGWNPCRRYPSTTECGYAGRNACGIPQAYECPADWRGRLGATWRRQIAWLLSYVGRRYGSPSAALTHWLTHRRTY